MPKDFTERIIDRPYDASLRRATSTTLSSGGGGGGDVPSPHALSGVHHSGTLDWGDLNKTGSSLADLATRAHSSLTGVTPNQHHNQAHVLATNVALGADHSISGATAGHVLRASSATAAAFAQLQHADLGGVTANQHHNQVHAITGSDHTATGSTFDLVGLSGTDTLGILTPSSNPGATAKILRTDSNGSLSLDTNLLYADAINNRVGINQIPGNAAIDAIVSSNADHTQRLKQKSGQTGRLWRVEDTGGSELIVLDSQGNLQSGQPGFTSGLTGWQITPTGTAEFNNVWVRGELHATVFVKDEVHISGGTLLVTTGGKLYSDAIIDAVTVDTEALEFEQGSGLETWQIEQGSGLQNLEAQGIFNYIEIEDSPSGAGFYFDAGETVRSKTEIDTGVTDFWFTIGQRVQLDGYQRYSVLKRSGTDGVLPAGAGVASYKQEGDGLIMLTSDLNYAPYMDVFTVGPNVWTGAAGAIVPHVRVGRLDGVGVTLVSGIEQYGMIAGTDLSNANSPYIVASNLQLGLHRVNLTLNDGTNNTGEWTASGNLTIGSNISTTNGKSFQVITTGADAGDVIIGRLASDYLHWDQSAGTLTVNGAVSIGGSGNLATEEYADGVAATAQSNAISTAAGDATSKASTAQTNAEAYGNARRIVAVSGTWTATDADTISWTSASIRFGNTATKTVTNGNTGNMAARSYLYVDATAAAPLTLSVTTNLATLTDVHALIAVADPGAEKASVSIVAGSTYISGGNIATNSILAANIKAGAITATEIASNAITADKIAANAVTAGKISAGAITADKISGTTLSAIKTDTGSLSVTGALQIGSGSSGVIRSEGKTGPNDTTNPGFWMGYSGTEFQFIVGDSNSGYMQHNGTTLGFFLGDSINIGSTTDDIFDFVTASGASGTLGLHTAEVGYPGDTDKKPQRMYSTIDFESPGSIYANKFDQGGDTMRMRASRTPASASATGFKGEWCWDAGYIYVCTATNTWRRIAHSTW